MQSKNKNTSFSSKIFNGIAVAAGAFMMLLVVLFTLSKSKREFELKGEGAAK
jgi:hypothetical protein